MAAPSVSSLAPAALTAPNCGSGGGGLRASKAAGCGSEGGQAGLPDEAPQEEDAAGHGRARVRASLGAAGATGTDCSSKGHFPGPHAGATEPPSPSAAGPLAQGPGAGAGEGHGPGPHAWSRHCLVLGAVAPTWTTLEQDDRLSPAPAAEDTADLKDHHLSGDRTGNHVRPEDSRGRAR